MSEDKIARRKPPKAQLITLWRGDSYMGLWLPVDGEGGAREFLNRVIGAIEPGTYIGSDGAIAMARELRALLPEEAENGND